MRGRGVRILLGGWLGSMRMLAGCELDSQRASTSFWAQDRKITAHEQLYQDATRRQERQITYASWVPEDVTFVPKIIRRAPETGKVSGHPGRKSTGNLAERSEPLHFSFATMPVHCTSLC